MNIVRESDYTMVHATIDEVLKVYTENCGCQYNYLCAMMWVEVERLRTKKSFSKTMDNISSNGSIFCADTTTSANMCFDLLKHAGLSKKGQARMRQYYRTQFDYLFQGEQVIETHGGHACLDDVDEVAGDEQYQQKTAVCSPFVQRVHEIGEGDLRLGILREVKKNHPDYMIKFKFNM